MQLDLGAVAQGDLVDHAGGGRDQVEVELATEPLLDLQMQQAEEAAAEAEAEAEGGAGCWGNRRASPVQPSTS